MRRWYEIDGMSVTEIANQLGRSPKLVWKVCKKHKFAMRPVGASLGDKNPSWKGGRTVDKDGYVLLHKPDHPDCNSNGYIREHRLVAESVLGRRLTKTEVVHHINDVRDDNRPENLTVFESNAIHLAETITGQVPQWTENGKSNIRNGNKSKIGRLQLNPIDWPNDDALRQKHVVENCTLREIAKEIGTTAKRLGDRMHYRGIPVRNRRSATLFLPRKQVLPTASVLSPKELDDFQSQGTTVHPVRSNGK